MAKKPIDERIAELKEEGLSREEIASTLKAEGYRMADIAKKLHVSIRTAATGFRSRAARSADLRDPLKAPRVAFMERVAEETRVQAIEAVERLLEIGRNLVRYEHHARLDGMDLLKWVEKAIKFYLAYRGWVKVLERRNKVLEKQVERLSEENRLLRERLKTLMILTGKEEA